MSGESEPIRHDDLSAPGFASRTKKELESLIPVLDKIEASLKGIAQKFANEFGAFKVEGVEDLERLAKMADKLKSAEEALAKAREEKAEIQKKVKFLTDEEVIAKQKWSAAERERTDILKNQIKLQQAEVGSINQLRAQLAIVTKEWAKLSETERDNSDAGKAVVKQKTELTEQLKKLEGATGDYRRNVGNYSGALTVLKRALDEVSKKIQDNTHSTLKNDAATEALIKEQRLLAGLMDSQVHGFASATQELRKNEKALHDLALAGMQNEQVYKDLLAETAKLKDSVGDLKAQVKNLASDTRNIDGLIASAQALAGGFGIAQGAAALFGDENEDLQKTFVKLQAVLTILNGLQAIQNALQKESAAYMFISNIGAKALAVGQRILTWATTGASAAVNTLKSALLTSGIGALLVLLPTAAYAMGGFGEETEDTANKTKELNEELEKELKILDDTIKKQEQLKNARRGGLDEMKRELVMMEAHGEDKKRVYDQEQAIRQKELHNLRVNLAAINVSKQDEIKFATKIAELRKDILDKENEIVAAQVEFNRENIKKMQDDQQELADKAKELADQRFADIQKDKERRVELIEGETARLLAEERLRHQNEIHAAIHTNQSLLLIEQIHQRNMAKIKADAAKRDLEDAEKKVMEMADAAQKENDEATDEEERFLKESAELRKKMLLQMVADEKLAHDERVNEVQQAQQKIEQIMQSWDASEQRHSNYRLQLAEDEIRERERLVGIQQERFNQGLSNQLAFEERERAKATVKARKMREQEQSKEELRQYRKILLEFIFAFAKEDPKNANMKALAQTLAAQGLAAGFTAAGGLFEGTEKIGPEHAILDLGTSKDPYVGRFHPGERLLGLDHSKMIPDDMSNADLVLAAQLFKSGISVRDSAPAGQNMDALALANAFQMGQEKIVKAIEGKPVQNVKLDELGNWTEEIMAGAARKIVHHKNRISLKG